MVYHSGRKTRYYYCLRGIIMTAQAIKLTISLPRELAQLTDEVAKEWQVSRSKVVSSCLQELAKKRFQADMEEGYKAMAKENLEFATLAMDLAHEVLPEWK